MKICSTCQNPLTVLVNPGDRQDADVVDASSSTHHAYMVDDDVELQCGCHFHWQCLLDAYIVTECANCGNNVANGTEHVDQKVVCNIKNEGGLQEDVDILPLLLEESYLRAFPEERRPRAFLEFCAEGDIEAIVALLDDDDDDGDDEDDGDGEDVTENRIDPLRYQDPINSLSSGLHIAIAHERIEVAWLLLLLATTLPMSQFPSEVLQAADRLQLSREDQSGKVDIRTLKDGEGMTPAQRAGSAGDMWNDWLTSGRLIA